jgi:hypothetical protein
MRMYLGSETIVRRPLCVSQLWFQSLSEPVSIPTLLPTRVVPGSSSCHARLQRRFEDGGCGNKRIAAERHVCYRSQLDHVRYFELGPYMQCPLQIRAAGVH